MANPIFSMDQWIRVPDGTLVSPFLNAKDGTSGIAWDLLDDFSIAGGVIEDKSSIQILPLVTQVVFVLEGELDILLKEKNKGLTPKSLDAHQALLIKPGSFFQLLNRGTVPAKVLYIVSPAYLFRLQPDGGIDYDDAFVPHEDWEQLELKDWIPEGYPTLKSWKEKRRQTYHLLALEKGK